MYINGMSKANDFVIVQQDWIARSMSKLLDFDLNKERLITHCE